jgi:hypothetical protein
MIADRKSKNRSDKISEIRQNGCLKIRRFAAPGKGKRRGDLGRQRGINERGYLRPMLSGFYWKRPGLQ